MANNYLQFSEAIYKLSEDERAWCEARLRHLEGLLPTLVDDGKDETCVPCAPEDRPYINGAGCLCFQWSINPEQNGYCLWIYAEEYGDAQQVALFVQEFLARFRSNEYFTLTWAETCSKPRNRGIRYNLVNRGLKRSLCFRSSQAAYWNLIASTSHINAIVTQRAAPGWRRLFSRHSLGLTFIQIAHIAATTLRSSVRSRFTATHRRIGAMLSTSTASFIRGNLQRGAILLMLV